MSFVGLSNFGGIVARTIFMCSIVGSDKPRARAYTHTHTHTHTTPHTHTHPRAESPAAHVHIRRVRKLDGACPLFGVALPL